MTAVKPLPPHGTTATAPVRQHIRDLMAAGTGWRSVADLAGVARSEVHRILYRNPATVDTATAEAILAVRPGTPRPVRTADTKADATGTRRRIRAMHHDGYDTDHIGHAIGEQPQEVRTWLRCNRIDARHVTAVTSLYAMWSGVPAETNGVDPEVAQRARALDRRRRWAPASAWCDDTHAIDDPNAHPSVQEPAGKTDTGGIVEDAEWLRETTGDSWEAIAAQLRIRKDTLHQYRSRARRRARAKAGAA